MDRVTSTSSWKPAAADNTPGESGVAVLSKETERRRISTFRKRADECGVALGQYMEMKNIFSLFDTNGSGSVDPREIRTQMRSLGFEVDNTTIYQLISDLDSDGSQSIEFEEFARLLSEELELYTDGALTEHSCGEVFDYMDDLDASNRDERIEVSNLRRIADVLGDQVSDMELEVMVRCADKSGKGYVTCEDFYQLMLQEGRKIQEEKQEEKENCDSDAEEDEEESETDEEAELLLIKERNRRSSAEKYYAVSETQKKALMAVRAFSTNQALLKKADST
eukprot:TRINITY_DN24144_c0_g1_i1.p1 TRINITY_DN24144_c0_g1~~TRINITY_DN24144_c0_g1_i1.p1  ORF type:complete len:280 (-),score=78.22 TRINITY_DN24144_c0_g1_i1:258-1097(-)